MESTPSPPPTYHHHPCSSQGDEWRHLTSADTGFKCTIRPRRDLNKLISECYLVRAEPAAVFSPPPQKVQRAGAGILASVLFLRVQTPPSQERVFERDVEEPRWSCDASLW